MVAQLRTKFVIIDGNNQRNVRIVRINGRHASKAANVYRPGPSSAGEISCFSAGDKNINNKLKLVEMFLLGESKAKRLLGLQL